MPITDVSSKTGTSDGKKSMKDKDKGKRLTKADICTPSDFRCVFFLLIFPTRFIADVHDIIKLKGISLCALWFMCIALWILYCM